MKISTVLTFLFFLLITLVKVTYCQEKRCEEPLPLGCPKIVCNLINSRKSDFCKDIQCEGIERQDCPLGTAFENGLTMCGCCSGCAKYQDVGDPCEVSPPPPSLNVNCTEEFCPILKNQCKPGLVCNYLGENSKVCALKSDNDDTTEPTCEYKRNQGLTGQLHWTPTCDLDGSYAPKQCKGERRDQEAQCFCVAPDGKRIFGREWLSKSANQTCACSRQVYTLRKNGNIATIHCSSDGNYEPLQCDMDSGLCYCVDPVTGKLSGAVLPEHQWQLLPCYSVNLTDFDPTGQYLRICESQWGAGMRIRKEALLHGLDVYAVSDFECDYDGSFGHIRRDKSVSYCVPKNGNLQESGGHFQEMGKSYMDCQCFRDSLVYKAEGRPFLKNCDLPTGNYYIISMSDPVTEDYRCVDKDGSFYGNPAPKRLRCCLLGDCRNEHQLIQQECSQAYQLGSLKKCLPINDPSL